VFEATKILSVVLVSAATLLASEGVARQCVGLDAEFRESEASEPLREIYKSSETITKKDLGISREDLRALLRNDPRFQWIANEILDGRVSFAMNQDQRRRLDIVGSGFLNYFQSGSSGTGVSMETRVKIEAAYSGTPISKYRAIPDSNRPKYGFLAPEIGSKLRREEEVGNYGEDTYIFKKEAVAEDTTWMAGDSLDQELPLTSTGNIRKIPKLERYLPWGDRDLLLHRLKDPDPRTTPESLAIWDTSPRTKLMDGRVVDFGNTVKHSYIELQFWKPKLNLDHVEAFIFSKTPPAGEFLDALRQRNIPIYRATESGDVLWTGGP
jgi:hypothetical protein